MKKTYDQITKKLKLVNFVIEVVDARAPWSTRNLMLENLLINKAYLLLLNKADLADANNLAEWLAYFKKLNIPALAINLKSNLNLMFLLKLINQIVIKKQTMINQKIKIMIIGVPNVGKSSLINAFVGKRKTKVGNIPCITKNTQWFKLHDHVFLLDTPGILWPKFTSELQPVKLLMIGSMKQDHWEVENLAITAMKILIAHPENLQTLATFYKLPFNITSDNIDNQLIYDWFLKLTIQRNFKKQFGEYDVDKGMKSFLMDLKNNAILNIIFEKVSLIT